MPELVQQFPMAVLERLPVPAGDVRAVVLRLRPLHEGIEGLQVDVKPLSPGIQDDRNRMRANHVIPFLSINFPNRHEVRHLRVIQD